MSNEEFNTDDSPELWRHSQPETTQLHAFHSHVKKQHGLSGDSYQDLWQWSVDNPAAFWEEVWQWTGMKADKKYEKVRLMVYQSIQS